MTTGISGTGVGFSTQSNQRATFFLRQNPLFSSDEIQINNEDNTEPQNSSDQTSPNSRTDVNQSFTNPFRALEQALEAQETNVKVGGTNASVSDGSVTLTDQNGNSLQVEETDNLTLTRTDDSIEISIESSDRSLTAEAGSTLETSGEGRLSVFGPDNRISVEAGQPINFNLENGNVQAVNPASANTLELSGESNSITVESSRDDQTDSLTFFSNSGSSVNFEQGESGTIERNEEGNITVTNQDTSQSVTFESNENLSILGEASGTITSDRTANELELSKGQDLALNEAENNGINLREANSANRTEIRPERTSTGQSGLPQLNLPGNVEAVTNDILVTNLLSNESSNQTDSESTGSNSNSSFTQAENDSNIFARNLTTSEQLNLRQGRGEDVGLNLRGSNNPVQSDGTDNPTSLLDESSLLSNSNQANESIGFRGDQNGRIGLNPNAPNRPQSLFFSPILEEANTLNVLA